MDDDSGVIDDDIDDDNNDDTGDDVHRDTVYTIEIQYIQYYTSIVLNLVLY